MSSLSDMKSSISKLPGVTRVDASVVGHGKVHFTVKGGDPQAVALMLSNMVPYNIGLVGDHSYQCRDPHLGLWASVRFTYIKKEKLKPSVKTTPLPYTHHHIHLNGSTITGFAIVAALFTYIGFMVGKVL